MKIILTLIASASVALAAPKPGGDKPYPPTPSTADIIAAAKAMADAAVLGKVSTANPPPGGFTVKLRTMVDVQPAPDKIEEVASLLEEKPPRNVEPVVPAPTDVENVVAVLDDKPVRTLQPVKVLSAPDAFEVKLAFEWKAPTSQFMLDLQKKIREAKAAGDTETYNKLVAQYTAWMNSYGNQGQE